MLDPDLVITQAWVGSYRSELNAALAVILAVVLARVVDHQLAGQGTRLGEAVSGGELTPMANTRLRLARRLISAAIIVIGFAFALSSFDAVQRVATGVLASSAVLGIVVGFAARQSLANAVAGVFLAITQPIRIGDLVTFEDDTGTVEDVRLTYTFIRAGDGRRIIVPNERLAQSTIENHTIIDPRVNVEASVWLPPGADASRALELLTAEHEIDEAEVAEVTPEGIRLVARAWAENAGAQGHVAARIRALCLERLRSESLSSNLEG